MTKLKFFSSHIFSPILLFLMINCITLIFGIRRLSILKNLTQLQAIVNIITILLACIGLAAFIYYLYLSVKEKIILLTNSKDAMSVFSSYVAAATGIFYLFMGDSNIPSFILFLAVSLSSVLYLLTLHEVVKNYKQEFVGDLKLVFIDSKNIVWFFIFNKGKINLKIKFNKNGAMINNNYIEKSTLTYYEDMFEKKITDLNNDELKLIDMYEI